MFNNSTTSSLLSSSVPVTFTVKFHYLHFPHPSRNYTLLSNSNTCKFEDNWFTAKFRYTCKFHYLQIHTTQLYLRGLPHFSDFGQFLRVTNLPSVLACNDCAVICCNNFVSCLSAHVCRCRNLDEPQQNVVHARCYTDRMIAGYARVTNNSY